MGLDAEGRLWLAAAGRGLNRWDGQVWQRLGEAALRVEAGIGMG
jgi:sugar lactone lactonase YvrE